MKKVRNDLSDNLKSATRLIEMGIACGKHRRLAESIWADYAPRYPFSCLLLDGEAGGYDSSVHFPDMYWRSHLICQQILRLASRISVDKDELERERQGLELWNVAEYDQARELIDLFIEIERLESAA